MNYLIVMIHSKKSSSVIVGWNFEKNSVKSLRGYYLENI